MQPQPRSSLEVTPVILAIPTRLGLALMPGVPTAPPTAQPRPSATTPPEIDFNSGREGSRTFGAIEIHP
jgi:hypothetical protein